MTFEVKVGIPSADEVLSVKDMKTTLYFATIKNDEFYGQFDDKLDPYILALHPAFIPASVRAGIEKVIASSKTVKDISLDDVVVAPAGRHFVPGAKITLDIRYRGTLLGSYDPKFKLRSIKRQRLSKKFIRSLKK